MKELRLLIKPQVINSGFQFGNSVAEEMYFRIIERAGQRFIRWPGDFNEHGVLQSAAEAL